MVSGIIMKMHNNICHAVDINFRAQRNVCNACFSFFFLCPIMCAEFRCNLAHFVVRAGQTNIFGSEVNENNNKIMDKQSTLGEV